MKILIPVFAGLEPRTAPERLSATQAQIATMCDMRSGQLRTWSRSSTAKILTNVTGVRTVCLYGERWLFWNKDVDILPGPIFDDENERRYYTGDGAPKMITKDCVSDDILGRAVISPRPLGVPAPDLVPTVTPSGGTGDTVSRVYLMTYRSDLGEEGAPTEPSAVTDGKVDDTWVIGGLGTEAPAGYEHITTKSLWRNDDGSTESAFRLVADIPISQASFNDTVLTVDLGDPLASLEWDMPPAGLQGLVAVPGGYFAGFVGNRLYFSEPWYPHAWPYSVTIEHPIVRVEAFGTTVVVLTMAGPYQVYCSSGPDAATVSDRLGKDSVPCLSARSVLSTPSGVVWVSNEGLHLVAAGEPQLVTGSLYTSREWRRLSPATMRAVYHDGCISIFYGDLTSGGGFRIQTREAGGSLSDYGFAPGALRVEMNPDAMFYTLEVDGDTRICQWEGSVVPMVGTWRSKVYDVGQLVNFGYARVTAEYPQTLTTEQWEERRAALLALYEQARLDAGDGLLNTFQLNTMQLNGGAFNALNAEYTPPESVLFRLFVDGVLRFVKVVHSSEIFSLPSGYKGRKVEFEVSCSVPVGEIVVATSADEILGSGGAE